MIRCCVNCRIMCTCKTVIFASYTILYICIAFLGSSMIMEDYIDITCEDQNRYFDTNTPPVICRKADEASLCETECTCFTYSLSQYGRVNHALCSDLPKYRKASNISEMGRALVIADGLIFLLHVLYLIAMNI